jgi:hypothetical protein
MTEQVKRVALVVAALCVVTVALVGCQTATVPLASSNNKSINTFSTPNTALLTPTPTFPPFTIGVWPSNYSPGNNDTITIYVLCRIQDQSMVNPPAPAPGLSVQIFVGDPLNQSNSVTTDADGMAVWQLQLHNAPSGVPIQVTVQTNYGGAAYSNGTFFTASPMGGPASTPTPNGTATPGQ